jgi:ferredoxin-nitrate reductase
VSGAEGPADRRTERPAGDGAEAGLDLLPDELFGMSRRTFFKVASGVGLGVSAGAMLPRAVTGGGRTAHAAEVGPPTDASVDRWTYGTCQFCATGCGLFIGTRAGEPVRVRGNPEYPVNQGLLCQKALYQADVLRAPGRATRPLRRRDGQLVPIPWDEALDELASALGDAVARRGPDAVAIYNTGQLLQEEYYVLSKLARGALGTSNLDGNPRLCMSSAVVGYQRSLGADGPPNSYEDLEATDCVLMTGANVHACHPIIGGRLLARLERGGCDLIVVDPRVTQFAQRADLHLPIRPGTDVALYNGMQHVLLRDGAVDEAYVEAHTSGFDELVETIDRYPPERTAELCEVPAADVEEAARRFAAADAATTLWTMGINQSHAGVAAVNQLCNLHLLTGQIGRPGAGPFSLTGQPSSMDFRQAGGGPSLPGYRSLADDEHRRQITEAWGIPDDRLPEGTVTAPAFLDQAADGDLDVLWIIGTNPAVSFPDLPRTRAALERPGLVVVQDIFDDVETVAFADLVLPAAMWGEKTGTFTNSERRVNLVRQAVDPPGEARSDFDIVVEVGRRLGHEELFGFRSTAEAFEEFAALTAGRPCDLSGITYDAIQRSGGLQWPVPERGHPGTPRLYTDGVFATEDGRAQLLAGEHEPPLEEPDDDYPFWLNTGRTQEHWHTRSKTGRITELERRNPAAFVELNPDDARRLAVTGGQQLRVRSRRGGFEAAARITARVAPGQLFVPFHFGTQAANEATGAFLDPFSSQPALKQCAVAIDPV